MSRVTNRQGAKSEWRKSRVIGGSTWKTRNRKRPYGVKAVRNFKSKSNG